MAGQKVKVGAVVQYVDASLNNFNALVTKAWANGKHGVWIDLVYVIDSEENGGRIVLEDSVCHKQARKGGRYWANPRLTG